ncbi:MAG TPA: PTS sugar transporter subunit IIA [Myxococcota bacterium]|nr:PTS sugar transporter subunit IIA [Myxococcota bacterium]
MKILDILLSDAVIVDLKATTKREVLEEICAAVAAAEPAADREKLIQVLAERERLQSTGIGEGVAIPHGKVPGLPRLIAAFAKSRAGVEFDSVDGRPTHLFFLLVMPENAGGQHLKALARISRSLRDPAFRRAVEMASTKEEVLRAIEHEDAKF